MVSSATDGDHDFDAVSGGERGCGVKALGHDLAVFFDRDALAGMAEAVEQRGNGGKLIERTRLAVERNGAVHGVGNFNIEPTSNIATEVMPLLWYCW